MDYEKFFEDELDDLSDCEEGEDHFQLEKDEFLAASIAQLKIELSQPPVSEGVSECGSGGDGDAWRDLMTSVQKTNLQLEQVSETIDSHVEMTPRLDDCSEEVSTARERDTCSSGVEVKTQLEVAKEHTQVGVNVNAIVEVEVNEEVRDMLYEMMVSVEYILSLAQDTTQTAQALDVAPLIPCLLLDLPLEIEFQEPAMEQHELCLSEAAAEDLFVYNELVDVDSSHKRKFEIAMSDTELAMREKEDEYSRAIEEDRIRREQRRARRKELVRELECAKAATSIQAQFRRHQSKRVLKKAREDRLRELREAEAARAAELVRQQKNDRNAEDISRRLMWQEDQRGGLLRTQRLQEEKEERERQRIEAERVAAEAAIEARRKAEAETEARKLKEAEEEARRQEEEMEKARKAQAEKERIQATKEAEKAAKVEAEKRAAAAAAHKKSFTSDQDSKSNKTSWGGFIQKTLGFGVKKDKATDEDAKVQSEVISPAVDETNYDEFFLYSDDEEEDREIAKEDSVRCSSMCESKSSMYSSSAETSPLLDLLVCSSSSSTRNAASNIEQVVDAALLRSRKEVQFTQVSTGLLQQNCTIQNENCRFPIPSWLLVTAFLQWQRSSSTRQLKNTLKENFPSRHEPTRKLDLSVESLRDIQFLQNHPNVEVLDLNVNSITTLDDIGLHAKNLVELSMKDNKLRCAAGLKDLEHLSVLRLDTNQLETLTSLENLTGLTEVSANMNNLSSFPALTSPALHKLELYRNQITSLEDTHLRALTSLTHLDLGRNKLTHVSGDALSQCPMLSQLILSQNKLTEVPSPLFLPNLRSLWLSGNRLKSLDAWAPSKESTSPLNVFLPLLEKLYLQDNQVESIASCTLSTSPFLMEIDLSFNSIRTFSNLAGLAFCPRLKVLQLQDNPVDKERGMTKLLNYFLPEAKEISGQTLPTLSAPNFSSIKPFILSAGDEIATLLLEAEADALHNQALGESCRGRGMPSACQFEVMLLQSARAVLCGCDDVKPRRDALSQESDEGKGYHEKLLMTLARMSSEHGLVRAKERVEVTTTGIEGNLDFGINSSISELCRAHLRQLLCWTPEQCERVQSYQTPSHLNHNPHIRRRASVRRRGGTKEALWRQDARKAHAALRLQACVRGFLLRRKMSHALRGARYEDDELEAMMRDQDGLMAEYGSILNDDAPEFSDGWLQTRRPPSAPGTKHTNVDNNVGYDGGSVSTSIVYGDHKRRRRVTPDSQQLVQQQEQFEPFSPDHNIDTSRRSPRSNMHYNSSSGAGSSTGNTRNITAAVNEWVSGDDVGKQTQGDIGSSLHSTPPLALGGLDSASFHEVPLSAASSSRFLDSRPASRSSNLSAASTPNRFGTGGIDDYDDSLPPTGRSKSSQNDWSAAHSTAVAAMISARGKRNKQEKSKDPTVRFEAFVKKSAAQGAPVESCFGNTTTSGSFGGKPKMVRKGKKGKKAPPAWLRGSDEGES